MKCKMIAQMCGRECTNHNQVYNIYKDTCMRKKNSYGFVQMLLVAYFYYSININIEITNTEHIPLRSFIQPISGCVEMCVMVRWGEEVMDIQGWLRGDVHQQQSLVTQTQTQGLRATSPRSAGPAHQSSPPAIVHVSPLTLFSLLTTLLTQSMFSQ